MKHTKSLMVLAGAALGLSSVAAAQQTTVDQSAQRELQSDASARSSFQGTGGPTMNWNGYTQFQFNLNVRDDGPANAAFVGDDSMTTGFRFAKTKLGFSGDVTDEWAYAFLARFGTDGVFELDDMYAQYTMDNGWNMQAGQKKLPFLREELVSDTGQLASQRSPVNENYTGGRSQGVFFNYGADDFRFMGAFSDGFRAQNTDIEDGAEADYAFTGRGEWKWAGEWDRFNQFSSWNGNENAGMAGGAFHFQDGGSTVGTLDNQAWGLTADVTVQGSGWNAFGAAVWAHNDPASGLEETDDMALLAQGGFFVNDDWELFLRGTWNLPDDAVPEADDFFTLTGGANWFITPQSQNAKLTLEVIWAGEGTIADNGAVNYAGNTGSGLLTDAEGGQFNFRAQLQIKF